MHVVDSNRIRNQFNFLLSLVDEGTVEHATVRDIVAAILREEFWINTDRLPERKV